MMAKVLMSHSVKKFVWMEAARGSRYTFISDNIEAVSVFSTSIQLFIWKIAIVILPKKMTGQGNLLCQSWQARAWSSLAKNIWPASIFTISSCFYSWGTIATLWTFLYDAFSAFPHLTILFLLQDEKSWKSYNVAEESMMDANYSLPDNVAIVTLQVS